MTRRSKFIQIQEDFSFLWTKTRLVKYLVIELTERCNFNCIHCYINQPATNHALKEQELSTEEIKSIFREAAALGCLQVRFTGGEPLLREDFEELYLFTRKLGMKVLLSTNASLITPRLVDLFLQVPPLEKLDITIYGMTDRSYFNVTRTSNAFNDVKKGINLLIQNKIPFETKMTLSQRNKNQIDDFDIWTQKKTNKQGLPPCVLVLHPRGHRDSKIKNHQIKKIRLSPKEILEILTRNKQTYDNEMKLFCRKFLGPVGKNLFSCGAGKDTLTISAYGDVQMCTLLRHPDTVFNIKKRTIQSIISNDFPKLLETKATNPNYLTRCAKCFLKALCDQCPARAWMEDGTLDTPVDYLCEIAHAKAYYLGLLKQGEKAWEIQNWKERVKCYLEKGSIN
ncbi:MAG: radical SAM protein [Candidatus Hodarchaeota archaeon]